MLKIFQRWARVNEVFISYRLNRWGRRFGFVRLFEVENMVRLEKELDRIDIGNMKLHVNIPKYKRDEVIKKDGVPREVKEVRKQQVVIPVKMKSKEVWKEKKGKEGHRYPNVKKYYAEVVRNTSQGIWKGP